MSRVEPRPGAAVRFTVGACRVRGCEKDARLYLDVLTGPPMLLLGVSDRGGSNNVCGAHAMLAEVVNKAVLEFLGDGARTR